MKMIRKKALTGQSTLEYLLVMIAVLLALIAATASTGSPLRSGVSSFLSTLGTKIGGVVGSF